MDEIRVELMTFPMLRERATNYATRPFYKLVNVLLLQNKRIEKKACYITTNWILRTFFIADLQGLSILSI